MTTATNLFFLLIAFLTVVSCQQARPLSDNEKVVIIDSIRHTLDHYSSDVSKDGLMGEFKYLDNSADFFWVPPGYSGPITYDSLASILKSSAPAFRSIESSFENLLIVPLTGELATYTCMVRSVMTDTSGHVTKMKMLETGIVIKRHDGWKLLSGQTSIADE